MDYTSVFGRTLPTFFDRYRWFLLPQAKEDEEEDQRDEDLKSQHPLRRERDERRLMVEVFSTAPSGLDYLYAVWSCACPGTATTVMYLSMQRTAWVTVGMVVRGNKHGFLMCSPFSLTK